MSGTDINTTPDITAAEAALAAGDAAALSRELAILYPQDPDLDRVEDLTRLALGQVTRELTLSGTAPLFFESITRTRSLIDSPQSPPCRRRRMGIGADLDSIAEWRGIERWTIPQCLNYLLLGQIRPTRRAAVVGTMRDDGIYILEWIAYYLALGFEHVFIYTNDNADGSDALLRILADHKVITLIESETSGKVGPEAKAYQHSIHLLQELRHFEWILYMDSDEYFVPAPRIGNSVHDVLAALQERFPERLPSCVCYPWLWFVSEMTYSRQPGFVIERFQHARYHWLTKALVRLRDVVTMHEHFPEVRAGGFLVDSAFEILPFDLRETWKNQDPQYGGGRVNHYWPKSFEEFAIKKARGKALNLEENLYDRPFELFFAWNGHASDDNCYPIDPVILNQVRERVEELKQLDGVGALADRIDRGFKGLLKRYYGGPRRLKSLYSHHRTDPTDL